MSTDRDAVVNRAGAYIAVYFIDHLSKYTTRDVILAATNNKTF